MTSKQRGFTLLEVMLVVVIIAIMASLIMPNLGGRSEQAKRARAKSDIAGIGVAVGLYELDLGQYPSSLDQLVTHNGSDADWAGPYLDRIPVDPWGRAYHYQSPGQHLTAKFDLNSTGKDGTESEDDINNWQP